MSTLLILIKRNIKIFFKDKGMFFVSLITPVILLVLYATFLGNVFKNVFIESMPNGMEINKKLIEGLVAGQLASSILATSCVTISFCSNLVMIQDKYTGTLKDLSVSPVKKSTLALSYFIASFIATAIVIYSTTGLCFAYTALLGWYLTVSDVFLILLDVFILILFGTALSSIIHFFLSTQGAASGVGSLVSSLYGFICGAYMPMFQFPSGLRTVLGFLPGTYGTVLLRNHWMGTAIKELHVPDEVMTKLRDVMDCNIYFFDNLVAIPSMYIYLGITVIVLLGVYILLNVLKKKH